MIEGQLAKSNGDSILPGGVSAVDLHFEPWVRQHEFAGLSIDKYTNLSKWLKKMKGMKEVEAAYKKTQDAASS